MLILPKIWYKSTFLHCSNISIEIPCNNVQFFTLVHAHKTKFGLVFLLFFFWLKPFQIFSCSFSFFFFLLSYPRSILLFTSFFLAGKVWTKSSVNPEKGTLINYWCVGLFMHRFCTKNGACFFRLAPPECS